MPRQVIAGEPGTRWLNETGKIYWQFVCSFQNSCGSCIADAGSISESWFPVPYHRGCNCVNQKILPGSESLEFLDFQQEIRQLDPAQQARVIGRNAWRLVEEGVVRWEDVVTRSRIRPLKDVVARLDLTEEALVRAGIPRAVAAEALARSDPAGRAATAAALRAGEAELRRRGLTPEAVRSAVARDLAARVGVVGPPPVPAGGPVPEPEADFAGPADAERFIREHWSRWAEGLTPGQRDAIETYKAGGVNDALRGKWPMSPEKREAIPLIDEAIARGRVPREVVGYRGLSLSDYGLTPRGLLGLEGGGELPADPGFLSVTVDRSNVGTYAGDLVLRVRIPKGTRAASTDLIAGTFGTEEAEAELILPRGTRLKVDWIRTELDDDLKTRWVVEARVIEAPARPEAIPAD